MADPDAGVDTQSMFLDDAISDDQLAQILAREHAGEYHWLAITLLTMSSTNLPEPSVTALRIVAEGVAQVVVERDRIWEKPSLRAWLAQLTIQRCQRLERQKRFRLPAPRQSTPQKTSAFPPAFQSAWDKMGYYERLSILLHYVLRLSLAEIAWVEESEPYPVEYWIREGLRIITYEASKREINPAAGDGEAALAKIIQLLFTAPGLGQEELSLLQAEISGRVQAARGRRRAAIAARETILVGLVMVALFLTCRAARLLPVEIIHRDKTPTPSIPETRSVRLPTPAVPFYFFVSVQAGDTLQILAQRAGTSVENIQSLNPNRFPVLNNNELMPGDRLLMPAGPAMDGQDTPIPVTPAAPLPPLTAGMDTEAILKRIENHRFNWHTLWASVRETYYGPPGYLGPAQRQLVRQIWLRQPPDLARVVYHYDPNSYYSLFLLDGFNLWVSEDSNYLYGEYIGEVDEIPWYYTGRRSSWMQYSPFFSSSLGNMGSYTLEESSLRVIREETHAGRRAVVLEGILLNGTRRVWLWVDALTGVILRRLDYSAESEGVVLREAGVEAIVFDAEFPAGIFNPRKQAIQGFVDGPSGTPVAAGQDTSPFHRWLETNQIRRAPIPTPPGFDPSDQRVFLQWPERWEQAMDTPTPANLLSTPTEANNQAVLSANPTPQPDGLTVEGEAPRIQVFAGPYLLGSLPLENVNFGGCRRSSNGRMIALRAIGTSEKIPNGIYWFSLEAPQVLHEVCQGCEEAPFVFSPDSRWLVFTACRELSSPPGCAIIIHDLPTGNQVNFKISDDIGEAYPFYLDWSPDARFLVILALVEDWTRSAVKILNLLTAKIIYSGNYNPASGAVDGDSPTLEWGLTLPPVDEMEMGCMEPSK